MRIFDRFFKRSWKISASQFLMFFSQKAIDYLNTFLFKIVTNASVGVKVFLLFVHTLVYHQKIHFSLFIQSIWNKLKLLLMRYDWIHVEWTQNNKTEHFANSCEVSERLCGNYQKQKRSWWNERGRHVLSERLNMPSCLHFAACSTISGNHKFSAVNMNMLLTCRTRCENTYIDPKRVLA